MARHTEYSFVMSFNERRSKNSHKKDIQFNICQTTVNNWKVKTQEKLLIIMLTNVNDISTTPVYVDNFCNVRHVVLKMW
jgi:hypothetical protein